MNKENPLKTNDQKFEEVFGFSIGFLKDNPEYYRMWLHEVFTTKEASFEGATLYLKEKERMKNYFYHTSVVMPDIDNIEKNNPEEAISIVEKWSKLHPKQTNADKFKEVFGFGHQGVGCNDCKIVYGDNWWDEPYEAPKEV